MKNIIFDWSGVVKDTSKSHLWIINRMFEKFGVDQISMEEFKKNWEQPYMVFYNKYLPELTFEEEEEAYKEAILNKDCPPSNPYFGIADFIKKLKQKKFFLAVITSDIPETFFPEIKEYGLEDIFDEVIVSAYNKTEALADLIKKNNLDSKETFFIGDSNQEIEAAKKQDLKA
jgi:phosphoglycolate phosphatase-like HAD superfamily hydrolase